MQEWINNVVSSPELSMMIVPAMFLMGLISSMGAFGCSIPAIGLIAGYAGANESSKKRDTLLVALGFMLGTVISLALLGYIIGFAGKIAGDVFSRYSRILAGLVAVFFGLMTLGLVPIKLPQIKFTPKKSTGGLAGAVIVGFVAGGGLMACTLTCCSPVLPILFGVAGLQGHVLKSTMLMAVFAVGFSIPMTALFLGVSFGKWAFRASKAMSVIKIVAGVLLIGIGFYFLLG